MTEMNEARFTVAFAKSLSFALSLIVVLMFARNFVPYPIQYAPLFIVTAFVSASLFKGIHVPRPTRSDAMPLLSSLIIALILLPYFLKNPIFPDLPSTDLRGHAIIARGIAQGESNPITSQVLYFGVHYLLALPIFFFPENPLVDVRLTMAVLAVISPYILYYASLRLFDSHRAAWLFSLVYALSGFVWFVQIFNVGIFANWFASLASLMLIAVSVDFMREKIGISSVIPLTLALLTAYLSHFTVLFLMIPLTIGLLLYSWREKAKKQGVIVTALILAPILFGLLFAKSITQTLFSLLQEGTGSPLQQTWLSQFFAIPIFKHLTSQVSNDFLMLLLLLCLAVFVIKAFRGFKSQPLLMVPLGWFLLIIFTAPLNDAAWRFSFVALLPLTMMAAYVLSLPIQGLKLKVPLKMHDIVPKAQVGITLLLIFPVFVPSWDSVSLAVSSVNTEQADQQRADYQAMQWIAENVPREYSVWNGREGNESGNITLSNRLISLTDQRFDYAGLFGTPTVLYAPAFHIITTDPFSVANLAINQSANYVIVTREMTLPKFPCQQPFPMTLSANATRIIPGDVVRFDLDSSARINASASLILDRDSADTQLINGKSYLEIIFKQEGNYTVYAQAGTMSTYPLTISVGNERGGSATAGVPERFCDPWFIFTPYSLKGSEIVYENDMVKVFKLR